MVFVMQCLSQDLETGCLKLAVVKFLGIQIFKGDHNIGKGKGIRFRVLYPPKCSHDLPPLAGTVHTETISIPQGIFQSNWQHIAHTL